MINCPKCNEENPPKFRLCGYCGAPLVAAPPALPVREVRRTVTLIFCDLKGSTALAERLDPEAMHEVKERYFTTMAAEITKHGGKIEKYIGDAIMAVFGLPLPHEDDALRAVRAAAGMQAALRGVNEDLSQRYGVVLANRTGVNTGEVVANDDPTADQKLATGDAVNVTARLEQAAPENEIYLGETTYRLVRDAVEVESVEPLELKGKSERVAAFRLVSAIGLDGYVRRHDSAIVGRDEELAAIDQALREVRETRGVRMITIVGDAGIGKSRLAQEVIARAGAKAEVVRGRCLAYGDGITFWPLREMTGEAAEIRFDDKPEEGRGEAGDAGRRPGRRRPPRRRGRIDPCRLPAARDLLGGAQVLRVAHRRRSADRARRRHPLGRVGVPRPARQRARHVRGRADPAALHVAPRPAREASRLGRAGVGDPPGAAPADRRSGRARSRSTCSAPPGCRPRSWRASSRPPRATRCTSSRCCRCSSTAAPCARRTGAGSAPRATARSRSRRRSRR